jgi:hypothetical protein
MLSPSRRGANGRSAPPPRASDCPGWPHRGGRKLIWLALISGSGQLGNPWERMHWVSFSGLLPAAAVVRGLKHARFPLSRALHAPPVVSADRCTAPRVTARSQKL